MKLRGPLIKDRHVEIVVGVVTLGTGFLLLHDAYHRKGSGSPPWYMRPLLPFG